MRSNLGASLSLPLVAVLALSSAASAVTIDWTFVGNPGNACDAPIPGCFGSVHYEYSIGTYEVTNAQYAEFLNAVAATDTNGLYNTNMGSGFGGITRSGSPGSYTYSAIAGRGNMPVNYVSFYDALRFANWLHNGQPTGVQDSTTTEDGAYTITAQGIANNSIQRNRRATIVLPRQNEWYKAAYYDALSSSYFLYPTGSNAQTTCASPSGGPNRANCASAVGDLTDVGSYGGSASPYGTFDQGGNVSEWTEDRLILSRVVRGGFYRGAVNFLAAPNSIPANPAAEDGDGTGFRVATHPVTVPSMSPLGIAATAGLMLLAAGIAVTCSPTRGT